MPFGNANAELIGLTTPSVRLRSLSSGKIRNILFNTQAINWKELAKLDKFRVDRTELVVTVGIVKDCTVITTSHLAVHRKEDAAESIDMYPVG